MDPSQGYGRNGKDHAEEPPDGVSSYLFENKWSLCEQRVLEKVCVYYYYDSYGHLLPSPFSSTPEDWWLRRHINIFDVGVHLREPLNDLSCRSHEPVLWYGWKEAGEVLV